YEWNRRRMLLHEVAHIIVPSQFYPELEKELTKIGLGVAVPDLMKDLPSMVADLQGVIERKYEDWGMSIPSFYFKNSTHHGNVSTSSDNDNIAPGELLQMSIEDLGNAVFPDLPQTRSYEESRRIEFIRDLKAANLERLGDILALTQPELKFHLTLYLRSR